ncbi:hypothetical protein PO909_033796, partial [Leuciscus waleckii]
SLSDGEKEECNEHSTLGLDSDTERPAEKLLSHGCDSDSEDSISHLLDDGLSSKRDTKRKRTTGMEDDPQSGLTLETMEVETHSTSHSFLSSPNVTKRTCTVQRLTSTSSDEETDELWNQSVPELKSPQHSHDIQRGCEFVDLTDQIPPQHNNIFETLGDDDKEDTVEWNEGDELGQTDKDQAIVMTWNLNENIILNAELNEAETEGPSPLSSNPELLVRDSQMLHVMWMPFT